MELFKVTLISLMVFSISFRIGKGLYTYSMSIYSILYILYIYDEWDKQLLFVILLKILHNKVMHCLGLPYVMICG